MDKLIKMAILLIVVSSAFGINGSIELIGEIRILNLWGSWEEMGYAYGYLLGPELKGFYEGYFVEFAGGIGNVNIARSYFNEYFDVPTEFSDYASGIITGFADTVSLYSSIYSRDIDVLDLYIISSTPDLSALVDFQQIFCSSVSAWGNATLNDPLLSGSPAISRNLDYYVDYAESILESGLLVTHDPDMGQEWISISFPGFMGCLSGMNETGISITLNMGNYSGTSITSPKFVPIGMAIALGLSESDFDNSGVCDIGDLMAATTEWNRSNTYCMHINSPTNLGYAGVPGLVSEVNNHTGTAFRFVEDEPAISPDRIVVTNHHRVLYPPITCSRYSKLSDSLVTNPNVDLQRLWGFMEPVGEVPMPGVGGTLQTMIFQQDQRRIGLAFSSSGVAAYQKSPEWIEWSDIYPNHDEQSVEDEFVQPLLMQVYPNPASSIINVSAVVSEADQLEVFDLTGRQMPVTFIQTASNLFVADIGELYEGLYFVTNTGYPNRENVPFLVLSTP